MERIYKVFSKANIKEVETIGLLVEEDEKYYLINKNRNSKRYLKEEYFLESIQEQGNDEYQISIQNNNKSVNVKLSKTCFGGCG